MLSSYLIWIDRVAWWESQDQSDFLFSSCFRWFRFSSIYGRSLYLYQTCTMRLLLCFHHLTEFLESARSGTLKYTSREFWRLAVGSGSLISICSYGYAHKPVLVYEWDPETRDPTWVMASSINRRGEVGAGARDPWLFGWLPCAWMAGLTLVACYLCPRATVRALVSEPVGCDWWARMIGRSRSRTEHIYRRIY